MNILIFFLLICGVATAQQHGCDYGHHNSVDYTPHTSYDPPDPVRAPPRRNNYPQDLYEGENKASSYNRPGPVYGPPPSRSRVAAAAGIYDDYNDNEYDQPAPSQPPQQVSRRYNSNYAQREPYNPRYDAYAIRRRPEYRVPVYSYYAPIIPDGFIPFHSHFPLTTEKPAATEETKLKSTPESHHSEHQHFSTSSSPSVSSSAEQEVYDDGQNRRQQPTVVAVGASPSFFHSDFNRYLFRKPFLELKKLFRGSILAKRDKIGAIPSFIQGATSSL